MIQTFKVKALRTSVVVTAFWLIKCLIRTLARSVSSCLPKRDHIIFCSDRYNENSRYLYEHLCFIGWKNIYWLSYDYRITQHLKKRNLPVLSNMILQIFYLMRAKIVISSGNSFWDRYGAVGKGTIRYSLCHGCGPKTTEYYNDFDKSIKILKQYNDFDYINFPNEYAAQRVGKCVYKLPEKKIVINGYPRVDQLKRPQDFLNTSNFSTTLCSTVRRVDEDQFKVLYTPTFRKYNNAFSFPLANLTDFNFNDFDKFLTHTISLFSTLNIHKPLKMIVIYYTRLKI